MMRSMFSGVSGLRAHQIRMDVIGNNIANVNTVAYKGSKMNFSEIYSQTVKGASGPQGGLGGSNPQQIGLGATVGNIDVMHTKGSVQRTDNATDIMVDGSGFFVISNDVNGQNRFYTRAGNFTVDKLGYLVAPNGFKVLDKDFKPVQINKSETKGATPSSKLILKNNINYAEKDYTMTAGLYDSLGRVNNISIKFAGDPLTLSAKVNLAQSDPRFVTGLGAQVPATSYYTARKVEITNAAGATTLPADNFYAVFNENGDFCQLLSSPAATPLNSATIAAAMTTATLDGAIGLSTSISLKSAGANDITVPFSRANFFENADVLTKKPVLTQYSKESDAKTTVLDGNSSGALNSFAIGDDGIVQGIFTNGEKKDLATIVLADFDNPAGLIKMGSNMFADTANSGTPRFGKPGNSGLGKLAPGALEMSNVDLAAEFTDMITTQRGFQANSKIISTTDEMLQELVNLKR